MTHAGSGPVRQPSINPAPSSSGSQRITEATISRGSERRYHPGGLTPFRDVVGRAGARRDKALLMEIRDGIASDLDFVIEGLQNNRALEGRPPEAIPAGPEVVEAFARELEAGRVRVVQDAGEPIAFLSFKLDFEVMYVTGRFLWVDLVYVHEDHRGRGLGRLLYEDAVQVAARHGCERVVADVFAANEGSAAFHHAMGFEPLYTIFAKTARREEP